MKQNALLRIYFNFIPLILGILSPAYAWPEWIKLFSFFVYNFLFCFLCVNDFFCRVIAQLSPSIQNIFRSLVVRSIVRGWRSEVDDQDLPTIGEIGPRRFEVESLQFVLYANACRGAFQIRKSHRWEPWWSGRHWGFCSSTYRNPQEIFEGITGSIDTSAMVRQILGNCKWVDFFSR